MPLAVWLLAQLAQRGNPPSRLLKRWTDSTTRLLRTEPRGREYNVEASIELSLSFLPALDVDAGPRELLSVCSLLPNGLLPAVREQLRRLLTTLTVQRTCCNDTRWLTSVLPAN